MKNLFYDFHTHSCLSPCADDGCTPAMLAGYGKLAGLDLMALTDHNTARNCPAFFEAAQAYGVIPVAGMELTTAEDIHAVCLFETLEGALEFDAFVAQRRMQLPNRPEVFGNQFIMDAEDNKIGEEPFVLSFATTISIDDVQNEVKPFGGIAWPAHIDRQSNGLIAVLGDFPASLPFPVAEVHDLAKLPALCADYPALAGKRFVTGSDAHALEMLRDADAGIEVDDGAETPEEVRTSLFRTFRGLL